ncbi:hypothetical protein llap_19244 [Limosa lapponica baueri]|uniref:Uncharacterized protein n=1 Tax=Limosa lapponica baueri TaxID=1758121 RepID=A0A2I0T9H0_LIMLA|nr:hypothetical protein llap_19244 [Limosa lapponica baueri]
MPFDQASQSHTATDRTVNADSDLSDVATLFSLFQQGIKGLLLPCAADGTGPCSSAPACWLSHSPAHGRSQHLPPPAASMATLHARTSHIVQKLFIFRVIRPMFIVYAKEWYAERPLLILIAITTKVRSGIQLLSVTESSLGLFPVPAGDVIVILGA